MIPSVRAERVEGIERLGVRGGFVGHAAAVAKEAVLGTHTGIVEARGDRVRRSHLAVGVLQEVAQAAVQHPGRARAQVALW